MPPIGFVDGAPLRRRTPVRRPSLGKTTEYTALICAANDFFHQRRKAGKAFIGPTMVVVPFGIRAQIFEELNYNLGKSFTVHKVKYPSKELRRGRP